MSAENAVQQYIRENGQRFVEELSELLRIPSISAESAHAPDMLRCAEWLCDALLRSGADRAEVMSTDGNPVVYAEKTADPAAPTVLVDPAGEWTNGPFDPVIREGRIWARGANDDKGQSYMHLKAMEAMLATGTLPCNLKFMLEGEEEIGSASLGKWCTEHQELLKADVILVSDTSLLGWKTPSITCGLRGLCYMEIEVTGPNKELHSGLYGGAVANPANVLARLIAALTDEEGRITIPHFYDTVRELTPAEREAFGKAPFCEAAYRKGLGIRSTQGETGYTTMERTGIRPSLERYLERLHRRRDQNGHPVESLRENLDATGARPGLPANRPAVRRVHAGARTCGRKRKCTGLARGIPLPHPYRPACLPGSSRSRRGDFRQRAAALLFRRQHPDHQHI